jgi:glycerophosphoryl diester phosphodiesterase
VSGAAEHVRVIAHRGGHDTSRQNTLGSYRDALIAGADAAELDVRLSRDAVPVLAHDPVQWHRRRPYYVQRLSSRRLRFLAALDEVLAEPRTAGHAVPVVLDVKRATELPDIARWCLDRAVDPHRIALWCRDPGVLQRLSDGKRFGELALLPAGQQLPAYLADAAGAGAGAVSLHPEVLSTQAVESAHAAGLRAYAWIRSRDEHRRAVECGVDGLVTDWIADALQAAGRAAPQAGAGTGAS